MQIFQLRGIAEGVTGKSQVEAINLEELFSKFSELEEIKDKLKIEGNSISGFAACDG